MGVLSVPRAPGRWLPAVETLAATIRQTSLFTTQGPGLMTSIGGSTRKLRRDMRRHPSCLSSELLPTLDWFSKIPFLPVFTSTYKNSLSGPHLDLTFSSSKNILIIKNFEHGVSLSRAVEGGLGQNHCVRQVHQPRRLSFGGCGRLVYAEVGDAVVAESLVVRLSSCKCATVRTISGE